MQQDLNLSPNSQAVSFVKGINKSLFVTKSQTESWRGGQNQKEETSFEQGCDGAQRMYKRGKASIATLHHHLANCASFPQLLQTLLSQ